jgi:metal-sulfur cluster biosynthetic enzyme
MEVAVDMNEREKQVYELVSEVVDPEIGIPISVMNLIDEVRVDGDRAFVAFHLSTPMCPLLFAVKIGTDIYLQAMKAEGVKEVEVKVRGHFYEEQINQEISEAIARLKGSR